MKLKGILFVLTLLLSSFSVTLQAQIGEWINLFDGKSLNGWKASEHPSSFSVGDSGIVVFGDRAHLFYEGSVNNHNFKNFEFKVKVLTKPGSNSGLFIHTASQETGWPSKGYEIQVNNTHTAIGARLVVFMPFRMLRRYSSKTMSGSPRPLLCKEKRSL